MSIGNGVNSDSTNVLTSVASICNPRGMAGYFETLEALHVQFSSDLTEITKLRKEQAALREAYLRFGDLERQIESKVHRLESTGALLANNTGREKIEKQLGEVGISLRPDWCANVSLWRMVREIVRQYHKTQIVQVCKILYQLGFEVTRQGVESALRTHTNQFHITRRGREKYVSLK